MKKLKNCPRALLQKLMFTALVGAACLIVGIAYYLFSHDGMFLALSCLVLLFSLMRTLSLYRIITKNQYEIVVGICVGVSARPLRKHTKVKIMDIAGVESTLLLGKQTSVKIGFQYCFYFSRFQRLSLGNEYLDTALSSNQFLGFEELGEFTGSGNIREDQDHEKRNIAALDAESRKDARNQNSGDSKGP